MMKRYKYIDILGPVNGNNEIHVTGSDVAFRAKIVGEEDINFRMPKGAALALATRIINLQDKVEAHDKPVKTGYYYFRRQGAPRTDIQCANVFKSAHGVLFCDIFSEFEIKRRQSTPVDNVIGKWFGPLPNPFDLGA